jgi:hypothetical protein
VKRLVLALAAAALGLPIVAIPALADPTTTAAASKPASSATPVQVYVVPTVTVYGRAAKPLVVVVVKHPTAAQEAGAAHESLRETNLARSEPAALRAR